MKAVQSDPKAVDVYISSFPKGIQDLLQSIRRTVRMAAPEASEKISWQMPAFYQSGILLCYAAFKNHVSIFPGPETIVAFEKRLKKYHTSKGTIQFPLESPLPTDLIGEIVKYRLKQNLKPTKSPK
jgi:uncharacterized protein YdhG (YjbR/CyaY superfamily)